MNEQMAELEIKKIGEPDSNHVLNFCYGDSD